MSKGLKIFLWTVAIVIALSAFAIIWGKNAWDKIAFSKPQLQALDLQGLTLNDLANIAFTGQSKTVTVTLGMAIKNDNNFSIPFSNMKVKLLYKDTLIAETSDAFAQQNFTVPANGNLAVADTVNVLFNNAGGQLLIEKTKGNHPQIDYSIDLKVFSIPIGWLIPKQSITF